MATAAKNNNPENVRLQVLLARCGLGSRRACEDFITTGRVSIDGEVVTQLGAKVDVSTQKVEVDGESIRPDRAVCYMLNKPKGMLCTNSDPSGRARVVDLFPTSAGRLFPIGRLDENSVGLLLVTNDGDLGHQLAHPKFKVPKIYEVQVAGRPTREIMLQLRQGMYFSDGRFKVDNAKITGTRGKSTILEVTLSEGRNREIRRLFSRVGHKVMKLERVAFGPLRLRGVTVGKFRQLSREEMKLLRDYIENGERRVKAAEEKATTETPKRKGRPEKVATGTRSPRKGPERRVVEIGPMSTTGGRDMTGRKRAVKQPSGKQLGRPAIDDDEDSGDVSAHPAVVGKKKPGPAAAKKTGTRKAAVRRPVTVSFESVGGSDAGSANTGRKRSQEEKGPSEKVSRKKPASRKKEVKAKNAAKRRKRR
ncbi:MAG: 23S rRNA pseudouridine2605 synthase [Porticoccaceae bacterium]|jgi:23S rRNA pseudouridine2605 synthase